MTKPQRSLVTGASGFIGSRLCHRLAEAGAEVHAISRTHPAGQANGLRWWQCDLTVIDDLQDILAAVRPEVVYNVAGLTQGARLPEVVLPTFQSNLVSVVNILSAAHQVGCRRVILTGSLEEPESGSDEIVPSSPYAASKWAASTYGRMFHRLFGLDVVMIRVFMVYGPGQTDTRKLIPHVILELLRGASPKLTSGERPVDWIYVDDVVEGFVKAAHAENVAGQTIDLGSGELVTVSALVELLGPLVQPDACVSLGAVPDRPMEQVRVANLTTAKQTLGWEPRVPLREGLLRTISWYRRNAPFS